VESRSIGFCWKMHGSRCLRFERPGYYLYELLVSRGNLWGVWVLPVESRSIGFCRYRPQRARRCRGP